MKALTATASTLLSRRNSITSLNNLIKLLQITIKDIISSLTLTGKEMLLRK